MRPLGIAFALLLASTSFAVAQKPNVIVFLADDMGLGDTSAYLGKQLEPVAPPIGVTLRTPNLDRLAQMGSTFTSAYSPASACTMTRYSLLTGRYAWRSNTKSFVVDSSWSSPQMIDPNRPTLASMFKDAGYETAALGKWHMSITIADKNGNPLITSGTPSFNAFNNARWPTAENPNVATILSGPRQAGFDYWYGTTASTDAIPGNLRGYFENETLQGVPVWTNPGPGNGFMPVVPSFDIGRIGETLGNKALDLIDAHAGAGGQPASDKPLFLYYASLDNHSIHTPPASITLQGVTYPIFNQARLTNGSDQNIREDTVYQNDVVIGALLDKLQNTVDPQTGGAMIDNTLIIFASDNGADQTFYVPNASLRGHKQEIYEGGVRTPFIAAWAGQIPQGAVSDQMFGLNDLYATLASVVGHNLTTNEAEDSENILPALLGQTTTQFRRPGNLILHDDTTQAVANDIPDGAVLAIRSGNFKLIVARDLVAATGRPAPNPGQAIPLALYDLGVDWHEDHNLLNDPAYATVVTEMQRQVLQYHNQGFSRSTIQDEYGPLAQSDGGANLMNNATGAVGYEFTVGATAVNLTRLGMWDDGAGDVINQESNFPNPDGDTVGAPDGLSTPHVVRLFDKASGIEIASVEITNDNSFLRGEFRYVNLSDAIRLEAGSSYALTMSTSALDGDLFHSPTPVSGASPITSSLIGNIFARAAATDGAYPNLLPNGSPVTGALDESRYAYRLVLGPTAMLAEIPRGVITVTSDMVDFNTDGLVDGADFMIWQRGVGMLNPTHADGDADFDGKVDGADLELWKVYVAENWIQSTPAAGAVPEPSSSALLACAAAILTRIRVVRPRRPMAVV